MLTGAFTAVAATYYLENAWLGLLCALIAGGAVAAIHAFWSIGLRSDQIVTGTAINLLAAGTTAFLILSIWGTAGRTPTVQKLPNLTAGINVLVPVAFALVPLVYLFLRLTKQGLRVMACGESSAGRRKRWDQRVRDALCDGHCQRCVCWLLVAPFSRSVRSVSSSQK